MSPDEIIVVTGIPRSGTTLMMRMLEAGGIPLYYDDEKEIEFKDGGVDYINYNVILRESSKLKNSKEKDNLWIDECRGKAVKILTLGKISIPEGPDYKFIWMDRKLKHCARSNRKFMLRNRAAKRHTVSFMDDIQSMDLDVIMEYIKDQIEKGLKAIKTFPNSTYIKVKFDDLISKSLWTAQRICQFLDIAGDPREMADLVVKRPAHCMPGMLEEKIYTS